MLFYLCKMLLMSSVLSPQSADSLTADCRLPTAKYRLPTVDCRLPTANCRLFRLPTFDDLTKHFA